MNYSVLAISPFDRQLKRLLKKYPSIKAEFLSLIENLERNPDLGTSLGNNCFKIRMSIASKGKGKSGSARIVTNFAVSNKTVYLLSIFDKSEKDNLSDKELQELLKFVQS
jgi:hypothetical protein